MLYRSFAWTAPEQVSLPLNPSSGASERSFSLLLLQPVAAIDLMSRSTVPAFPSPHTAIVFTSRRVFWSGQTLGSSEHSLEGSPVLSLLQSEKLPRGITMRWISSDTGASKCVLKPEEKKLQKAPRLLPNWKRYPSYCTPARALRTTALQLEMSGNGFASCVCALMKPGACRLGTSTTSPRNRPRFPETVKFPVDLPPITGSLSSFHSRVVDSSAPSNVARTISSAASGVKEMEAAAAAAAGLVYVLNLSVPQGPAFCEISPAGSVYPSDAQEPFFRLPFDTMSETGQIPTVLPRQSSAQVSSSIRL
mmetsp:Transcript_26518/g.37007  ORF Transcript_26518/g.37007 Transcript_26518/m.37007 type:complete len:307 (-) Transcript_26518:370-1290(-)